eukprot:3105756-Rhodomonas_salina.3
MYDLKRGGQQKPKTLDLRSRRRYESRTTASSRFLVSTRGTAEIRIRSTTDPTGAAADSSSTLGKEYACYGEKGKTRRFGENQSSPVQVSKWYTSSEIWPEDRELQAAARRENTVRALPRSTRIPIRRIP